MKKAESSLPQDAVTALGSRWTRHSGLYALSAFGVLFLSLINIAVLTRYLDLATFGVLGVLMIFSTMLTVLYNLGSLQGILSSVFGSADDDDADFDDRDAADLKRGPREMLGIGIVFTAAIGLGGTAIIAAALGPVTDLLLGSDGESDLVLLAAVSAAIGAVWRLAINVVRLERRVGAYALLNTGRPVLVLAVVIPLVASGGGIHGVLTGLIAGNVTALLLVLLVTRKSYKLSLRIDQTLILWKRGAMFIPIIVGYTVIHNAGMLMLPHFTTPDDVGLYRLASRVGAVGAYLSSAFISAWNPLQRSTTFQAIDESHGRQAVRGLIVCYFAFAALWMLLGFSLGADALVRIAPPEYSAAAPLIPLLAAGFLAQSALVVVYRAARFANRRPAYVAIILAATAIFLAITIPLIKAFGADGAGYSIIIVFGLGIATMWALSQRGPLPIELSYARLGGAFALAAGGWLLARGVAALLEPARLPVDVLVFVAFPLALIATDIVPRSEARALGRMVSSVVPRRWKRDDSWAPPTDLLDQKDVEVIDLVARQSVSVEAAGESVGLSEEEVQARLARGLRHLAWPDSGPPTLSATDTEIGAYLVSDLSVAEREALARNLYAQGVTPTEMDVLERSLEELRVGRRVGPR